MPAVKYDTDKPSWDLLPYDALEQIVHVAGYGAQKYGQFNWTLGMSHSRLFAAAMRHMTAHWRGEDIDPESQLPHLAHAAINILFLLAYCLRNIGPDDRDPTASPPK